MKKIVSSLIILTLALSVIACSEIGLKDVNQSGAGIGYLSVAAPIDGERAVGEDKRLVTANLEFELKGEDYSLSSEQGDSLFSEEIALPNGEYKLSISGKAGEEYYGREIICKEGQSFTKEGFRLNLPINDTVYVGPKLGDYLEQRKLYLLLKDQSGQSLKGAELDSITVDGVEVEQLEAIDLDMSPWQDEGMIILEGMFIGEREIEVVTEDNARGVVTTEIKSRNDSTATPTLAMELTLAAGYRFSFDADNYEGVNAEEIDYVHLAGEFNGFDDENREFVLSRQDDGTWQQEFTLEQIMQGVAKYEGEIDNIDHDDFIDFKWIVNGGWVPEGFGNNLKVDDSETGVEILTTEVDPIDPIIDDYVELEDDQESPFETKEINFYFKAPDWATDAPTIDFHNPGRSIYSEIEMREVHDGWYHAGGRFIKDQIDTEEGVFFQIVFSEGAREKRLYAGDDFDAWQSYQTTTDELWIDATYIPGSNWKEIEDEGVDGYYLADDAYTEDQP